MISLYIPAPRVNKLQKTGKEFSRAMIQETRIQEVVQID